VSFEPSPLPKGFVQDTHFPKERFGRRRVLQILLAGTGASALANERLFTGSARWAQNALGGVSLAQTGGLLNPTVSADGWRVSGILKGLAPNGIAPLAGWGPLPSLAYLTVRGPGWDITGVYSGSRERRIRCNDGVDRMWQQGVCEPKTIPTTPQVLDAAGNDLKFELASTAYIYPGETVSYSASQGWFSGADPVADVPVQNDSLLPYAKPMIDWVEPQRDQVVGTFKLRLAAGFHLEARNGRPLAAVKVTGTPWNPVTNAARPDGVPVTKLAAYEWSGTAGIAGGGSAVWAAEFSESDFPCGPGLVRFSFEDCPWFGTLASQRSNDTKPVLNPRTASFSTFGEQTSIGCGIHPVIKWVGALIGQRHVYVASDNNSLGLVGNDQTGACQSSFIAAKARPFRTFDSAWRALFDASKGGNPDSSGSCVWLSDGIHALPQAGFTGTETTRRANDVSISVQSDPVVANPMENCLLISSGSTRYILFAAKVGSSTSFVIFRNMKLVSTPANIGQVASSNSVRSTYFYFDGCRVHNESGSSSLMITSGAIIAGRNTTIFAKSAETMFSSAQSNSFCTHFYNCTTNSKLNANVVWGLNIPSLLTTSPFQLGVSAPGHIRDQNLLAGYVYAPIWEPKTAGTDIFLNDNGNSGLSSDWGISVAFCCTTPKVQKAMFVKAGELIDRNYRNFISEAVTTMPAKNALLTEGTIGFNVHNDPATVPLSAPGNGFDQYSVRNSNLGRMAVKGPLFWAVNGNGIPKPASAHLLTGGRTLRQGVMMHGLIVRSCNENNMLHSNGLFSVWGTEALEYKLVYADEAAGDFRPAVGFAPIPADLIGHGFDLAGAPLFLDGTDAPGAFRRV
jgi:hypothetical protein